MNRRERRRLKRLDQRERGTGAAPHQAVAQAVLISEAMDRALDHLQAGEPGEALTLYRRVLDLQPDHPEALNLGGVAAFQAGDARRAEKLLRQAVAVHPHYVDAYNNLGNVLKAAERLGEAEAAYRRALESDPDYVGAHFNLGIALDAQGRFADAEAAFARALELEPDYAEAAFARGNALKAAGRLHDAVAAYQRALTLAPDHADGHNNLASALRELGKLEEAEAACRRALALSPQHVEARYNLGVVLQERGELEDAVAAYRETLAAAPLFGGALVNLGYAQQRLGRLDEAIATYRRAIAATPDFAGAHVNLADALLEGRRPARALEVCDAYLEARPGDTALLAMKAVVLDELGEREAVRALMGLDRFVRPLRVTAPAGFATLAEFNARLADHVSRHPTLVYAPASHATRLGQHSGELFAEPKGPAGTLEGMIRGAVEDYLSAFPADADHPFLAHPPRRFGLTAWCVIMDSQGHQLAHNHPAAWLSGVYYAALPAVIGAPGQGDAGCIEFGRPPQHFHCAVEPEVRLFRPEEGLMILFPSYLYHRTLPFEADEQRISVAFDVLRED